MLALTKEESLDIQTTLSTWMTYNAKVISNILIILYTKPTSHDAQCHTRISYMHQVSDVIHVYCVLRPGHEAELDECTHSPWYDHNCETTEAASVTCMIDEPTPQPRKIRCSYESCSKCG